MSGQPCLVSDFSGIASSFSHFNLMLAVDLRYIAFIMFRYCPWISELPRLLAWRCIVFCQKLFEHLMWWSCDIFLWVCLYSELYCWMSLFWTIPAFLNDHFDVFLDSVCKNFIEYFCIDIHKGNWSKVLFLCWVFVWFSYQSNCMN